MSKARSVRPENGFECMELRDFIKKFKKRSKECILNVYQARRPVEAIIQSNRLATTLPSEIFTIVTYDTVVIHEYQRVHSQVSTSTDIGCTLAIHCAKYLIEILHKVHKRYRNNFYDSLERCCAAANDFLRMINLFDDWLDCFIHSHQLHRASQRPYFLSLQEKRQDLTSMYLQDAVYSAQIAHTFVMEPIQLELSKSLYSKEWEFPSEPDSVVTSIIKTLQDFLQDVQVFLASSFLLNKFLDVLMTAMVTFLVQQLLFKAKHIRHKTIISSKTAHRFKNPHRAANQFFHDVATIRLYFETLIPLAPGLETSIQRHFHPLESICVLLNIIISWNGTTSKFPEDDLQKISHVLHRIAAEQTAEFIRDFTLLFTMPTKLSTIRARNVYNRVRKYLETIQVYEKIENYSYYSFMDETQSLLPPVLRLDYFLSLFYQRRVSGPCSI